MRYRAAVKKGAGQRRRCALSHAAFGVPSRTAGKQRLARNFYLASKTLASANHSNYYNNHHSDSGQYSDGRSMLRCNTCLESFAEGKLMKELIEQIAKAIVERPEDVQVRGIEGENAVVIELRVAKEDIGKVIGKKGKTITAMRTILNATRAQKSKRQVLEVVE